MIQIDLSSKVAVVTGGNRGIGLGIARTLGLAGATVVICARNADALKSAQNQLQEAGLKADSFVMDIADSAQVAETASAILKKYEKVHILVNNAGLTNDKLVLRMSTEDWLQVINVNLNGTFSVIKSFLRPMVKQQYGRIINITSVVGLSGNAGQANYAASKAGIIGLTKSLAKEIGSRNITVNAIAPGFVETDMTGNLSEDIRKKYLEGIPLGRFGTTEDIANGVLFLASDLAAYMTGQTLVMDGGMFT